MPLAASDTGKLLDDVLILLAGAEIPLGPYLGPQHACYCLAEFGTLTNRKSRMERVRNQIAGVENTV